MSLRTVLAVACACLAWAPAASAQVVINEVVTHPQQHWDDGTFNPTPSPGTPTDNDEWIELYNPGTTAISLSGWSLQMNDGTNNTQTLDTFTDQYYSAGSSLVSLKPGGFAVFGNPSGDMADTGLTVILTNQGGQAVDQVTIDLTGAPGHGMTGAGTSVATESVFRSPNGADTGNDAVDFAMGPATFGSANPGAVVTPGAVVINEVVTQPQHDWNDAAGPFDPNPGNGTKDVSDQWVELLNKSAGPLDLTGWSLAMTDATPAEEYIGFDSAFLRFSSGCSMTSFGNGCRAVIGDPAGAMSNAVYLQLIDFTDHLVDDVELGDDPEGDGAGDGAPSGASTGVTDESVCRLPDGADTNTDKVDFKKCPATILAVNAAPPPPDGGSDAGSGDAGGMDGGGDAGATDGGVGGDGGAISDGGRDGGGGGRDGGLTDSGGGGGGGDDGTEPPGGCSCSAGNGGLVALALAVAAMAKRRRRAA
ncbi:MAG TPA: lamin tail domain-containing protein [Myxococcaceae bacterium]|nr:lamin tail domain-containing protein [Myxococcaceae bacterium]